MALNFESVHCQGGGAIYKLAVLKMCPKTESSYKFSSIIMKKESKYVIFGQNLAKKKNLAKSAKKAKGGESALRGRKN